MDQQLPAHRSGLRHGKDASCPPNPLTSKLDVSKGQGGNARPQGVNEAT